MCQHEAPGLSKDTIRTAKDNRLVLNLLSEQRILGRRMHDFYKRLDPKQFNHLETARTKLKEKYAAYEAFKKLDPTFFTGRAWIWNRQTPRHIDKRDSPATFTPCVSIGHYTKGIFKVDCLNVWVNYPPGVLVYVRGGLLEHEVLYEGGQRVADVHFIHQSMLDDVEMGQVPLMTFDMSNGV
jgi:hypothetical protein